LRIFNFRICNPQSAIRNMRGDSMSSADELNWDSKGLIPAVVQDADSGEVLTVAYMSRESLARTRELNESVFFSRSRDALWHKGETSGNTQKVVSLAADCDRDALLLRVRPRGPACHTGARSCFFETVEGFSSEPGGGLAAILSELEHLIERRKTELPEASYTAKLFKRGLKHILQKVGEEASETVIAGMGGDREEMIRESSDLLFHLLVALREMGIPLSDVARELRSRRH
jgi:phosphoribosyl-ATP pyrophosphohydrolase/phosphoribosyl-AMP cyclohydrolase